MYFFGKIGWYGIINILKTSSFYFPLGFNNFHIFCQQEMDYLLDDDALDVAPSMISDDEEEDPSHHTDSNHVCSWTPFSPDLQYTR